MLGALLSAVCLASAGQQIELQVHSFTLRWNHSIEKIEWDEDYEVAGSWLLLTQARIRGDGAGMEPPPDASFFNGVWHYRPADPWRRELWLARSPYVPDYELCLDGRCLPLEHWLPRGDGPTRVWPCSSGIRQ
ncbi:MAG TPA: DUF1850 domain-containing protein [Burkholderiaceae bacterium]|jgi:hypothetical protein